MIKKLKALKKIKIKYNHCVYCSKQTQADDIVRTHLEAANRYAVEYNNSKFWFQKRLKETLLSQGVEIFLKIGD